MSDKQPYIPEVGGDKSMQATMAAKMQLVLDQPMSDITTKLVNHDFEGEFFKVGDTVNIVKPSVDSVNVQLGSIDFTATLEDQSQETRSDDRRIKCKDVRFSRETLQIDKFSKYAFIISDITKAEGKWDYVSGQLDIAAQTIRKAHNVEVCELIANDAEVRAQQTQEGLDLVLGTAAAPIQLASVDELYSKVLVTMHSALYNRGAITSDGQITYGSNPQQGKATTGAIFMPMKAYNGFLTSKYFTERSTTAADDKVATGNIAKVLGLDVNIEPALDPRAKRHATVANIADNDTLVIVAGTSNAVTRAGKVLPPDRFRSHERFAEEFHGLEIYGQKLLGTESVVVAYVKMP